MSKNKNDFVISVFECGVCKRSFDRKASLIIHSKVHSEDKPLTCKFCQKKFLYKYLLNKHLITNGPEKCTGLSNLLISTNKSRHSFVKCPQNSTIISNNNTNWELINEIPPDIKFECDVCKRSFNRKASLIVHERTHLNDMPLTCGVCEETFLNKSLLNKHLITLGHSKSTEKDKNQKTFNAFQDKNNSDVQLNSVQRDTKSIAHHKFTKVGIVSSEHSCLPEEDFSKCAPSEELFLKDSSKSFQCETCKEVFKCENLLSEHVCSKTQSSNTKINIKEGNLQIQNLVKNPISTTSHTYKKLTVGMSSGNGFECNVCKISFARKSSLVIHSRVHLDDKSLTCKFCQKKFLYKYLLNRHLITEGPEKCTGRSNLQSNKHSISNTNKNRKQSFVSGIVKCPKNMPVINNMSFDMHLTNEESSDKSFECNVCKKLFDRKSSLILHQRTHLDDRPLTCKVCQTSFLDKSLLNRHLIALGHVKCMENDKSLCTEKYRKLINEYKASGNSFKCFICPDTFNEECTLKDHLYLHIGTCKKSTVQGDGKISEGKIPDITIVPFCVLQDENNIEEQFNSAQSDTESNANHEFTKVGMTLSKPSCLSKKKNSTLSDKLLLKDRDQSFRCKICKEVFKCENLLSEHVCPKAQSYNTKKIVRRKLQYQNCLIKPIRTTRSEEKFNFLKKKSFVCLKCQEVFENKSSLELHFCISRKNTVIKTYNRASTTLKSDASKRIDEHNLPVNDGQSLDIHKFICTFCKQHFCNEEDLNFHLRIHIESKFVCEDCQTVFDARRFLVYHRRYIRQKQYLCNVCKKAFCYKKLLINHSEIHSREKELHCNLCDRFFKNKFLLNLHYFSHKKNVPFFICSVCLETFSDKNKWILHRSIHMGIMPHICEVCKKYFIKRKHFYLHCRIHTDEAPYNCETCHKTFKYHNTLIMHQCHHIKGNT